MSSRMHWVTIAVMFVCSVAFHLVPAEAEVLRRLLIMIGSAVGGALLLLSYQELAAWRARMKRRREMKERVDTLIKVIENTLAETLEDPQLIESSMHPYDCTCDLCREWWLTLGPDGDTFGPYGDALWEEYAERKGISVEEAKAEPNTS